MRSEVIQPPPPTRLRTVVLRAGPPKGRRPLWDSIIGVIGLVLLVLAAALVVTLPEPDVFMPQFEVTATEERLDGLFDGNKNIALELTESNREAVIEVLVEHDNVHNIVLDVGFQEDYPESRPDTFETKLVDPLGRTVDVARQFSNSEPEYDGDALGYPATRADARYNFAIGPKPQQEFLTGTRADVTPEQVRELYLSDYHLPTQGTWKIHLKLVDAGDCPMPTDDDADPVRIGMCRNRDPNGEDPGNVVTIEAFQYTYFDVQVSEL